MIENKRLPIHWGEKTTDYYFFVSKEVRSRGFKRAKAEKDEGTKRLFNIK